MMDVLQEELDRSFGGGPPLPSVDSHVVAGRRALRRRRAAGSAAGLAAAAVLVTVWYAVPPGSPDGSDRQAVTPTASDTPSTSQAAEPPSTPAPEAPWPRGTLIRYTDGELEVRPGVIVHEHLRNPYGFQAPELSDALDVTWRGERRWLMIEKRLSPSRITESSSTPSSGWASFGDYVADQVGVDGGSGWPDTVRLDDRGQVVAAAGARVLERTDDPRLGPTSAPPGAGTRAALVSVAAEQRTFFVVWRVIDGSIDVITTGPDDIAGATFDELVSDARASYASGEGLR